MTPDELTVLRKEAAKFLAAVQELDGFAARREELKPPPVATELPLTAIRRVLAFPEDPIETDEAQKAAGTGLLARDDDGNLIEEDGIPEEMAAPSWEELESLAAYDSRLREFAKKYLAGAQWGARATHHALRRDEPIKLPGSAPDYRFPLPDPTISGAELHRIAEENKPESELRGDRSATWSKAVAAVEARLQGKPPARRDTLRRAARYLDAAVNGSLDRPPLEPSDDPAYEERIEQRFKQEFRLKEVKKGLGMADEDAG